MKKVLMPKEGEWFRVGNSLTHTCCECGVKHKWEFGWFARGGKVVYPTTWLNKWLSCAFHVRITRIDRRKK